MTFSPILKSVIGQNL